MDNRIDNRKIQDQICDLFEHAVEESFRFFIQGNRFQVDLLKRSGGKWEAMGDLSEAFRHNYLFYQKKACEFWKDEQSWLDSHKLAASAIITVLKIAPFLEIRNDEVREDNLMNEYVAERLAYLVMQEFRKNDYCGDDDVLRNELDCILANKFPSPIYENKSTPKKRLLFVLAHLNPNKGACEKTEELEKAFEKDFPSKVRKLAYLCYLFDVYYRNILAIENYSLSDHPAS